MYRMILGGGPFNGFSPKQTITNYKDSDQALIRKQLRVAWNTQQATGKVNGKNRIITPFRAVTNSGDFLSRQAYICGGPNPSHLRLGGIRNRFGSILSQCDGTGVPAASANGKFVPDASEYTKYKKQNAMNNNYNDKSNGGYNNAAYPTMMRLF